MLLLDVFLADVIHNLISNLRKSSIDLQGRNPGIIWFQMQVTDRAEGHRPHLVERILNVFWRFGSEGMDLEVSRSGGVIFLLVLHLITSMLLLPMVEKESAENAAKSDGKVFFSILWETHQKYDLPEEKLW